MNQRKMSLVWMLLSTALLTACGGGGDSKAPPGPPAPGPAVTAPSALSYTSPNVYVVGTAITALSPTVTGTVTTYSVAPALPAGLQLAANGQISGTPTAAAAQTTHVVTASNSGGNTSFNLVITVNAPVINYSVGGSVSGLTGSGLVLANNGGNNLAIGANGAFTFTQLIATGANYAVTVATQPAGQNCTVAQGTGAVAGANVTNVAVTCTALPPTTYSIGGTVSGLVGAGLVLLNNGGDPLSVPANGAFTFNGRLTSGSNYAVTVGTQPAGKTCMVSAAAGVVGTASVTNVAVNCFDPTITMGGTVIGLTGSGLKLNNNFTEVAINGNGPFTFPSQYSANLTYNVVVSQQATSPAQTCAIANGRGTTATTTPQITNIVVACVDTPAVGRFLFVANYFAGSISAYTINASTGSLTPVAGSPYAVAAQTHQMLPHPNKRFLYTRNATTNNIQAFAINQTTGALTSVAGSPFAAAAGAGNLSIDRSGKWAVVANTTAQNISVFAIDDTTGVLTAVPGSPFATGFAPGVNVYFRPDSKFLYVSNPVGNAIAGYSVNATTGALTAIGSYPSTHSVTTLTIDALGKFLYGSTAQDSIYAATIDNTTGALTAIGTPVATGDGPAALVIEPLGRFLYVAMAAASSPNDVSGFAINPTTGALTPAGVQPTVGTGGGLLQNGLAVRLDARFMFAATLITDTVVAFEIDSTTGQLYSVAGSPTPTSGGPNPVTIDPSGRWVYVTNAVTSTVSVYSTSFAAGTLTAVPGSPFPTGSGPIGQVVVQ
jgi:6-phosphogluconolactonase (cycloisomerase 2 family)